MSKHATTKRTKYLRPPVPVEYLRPPMPVDTDGKPSQFFFFDAPASGEWYVLWPRALIGMLSYTPLYHPEDDHERLFVAAVCAELWFVRTQALVVAKASNREVADAVKAGCAWRKWGKLT